MAKYMGQEIEVTRWDEEYPWPQEITVDGEPKTSGKWFSGSNGISIRFSGEGKIVNTIPKAFFWFHWREDHTKPRKHDGHVIEMLRWDAGKRWPNEISVDGVKMTLKKWDNSNVIFNGGCGTYVDETGKILRFPGTALSSSCY